MGGLPAESGKAIELGLLVTTDGVLKIPGTNTCDSHMPVIPTLERQRQEDCHEVGVSLG